MKLGFALLVCLLPLRLSAGSADRIQSVTDELRARLDILESVQATLVEHNPLVMSVETLSQRSGPFVIAIDQAFARTLSDDELKAAIAHELGHVWIYTHYPYVQSERFANDIAMRVVSRSLLGPVYEKVWKRTGMRGNLVEFLGLEAGPLGQ